MHSTNSGNRKVRSVPGETGIWVFVLGDMSAFGVFFAIFVLYRGRQPELYRTSQALLDQNFGAINTMLLLASSWFVAMGIEAVRKHDTILAPRLLGSAMACGLGFLFVKFLEWSDKLQHGIGLTTNDFFTFYFMLTGIHLLHVIIGMMVLALLWKKSKAGLRKPLDRVLFESGAIYWHMVDVLWIVLFPLFYLVK